ncbi:MAG: Ig-like domain repeat protein [Lachnospiraceae bacterium]|nr:Ig-like domain repeat protein [Lachnospiraceae bacterium]
MRRKIIGIIITSFICMFTAAFLYTDVYADEIQKLGVELRTYDNDTIAVMEGKPVYSAVPVRFVPQTSAGIAYSISTDDGETFGTYAEMNTEEVVLYPDDDTSQSGRWQIRFKETKEDGIGSDTFKVCFDTALPKIEIPGIDDISDHMREETELDIKVIDDIGISRIIVRCEEDILFEMHGEDEERILKEHDLCVELKDTGKTDNEVTVSCFDLAGNCSVATFKYGIDKEAPVVTAAGIDDGAGLNTAAKLCIIATDDSLEPLIDYTVKRQTGDEVSITSVTNEQSPVNLSFDEDGKYSVEITAVDKAQNRSSMVRLDFLIDSVAPVVDISGASDGVDLRSPSTVTVDITEENHEDTVVDITLSRTVPGSNGAIRMDSYRPEAYRDIRTIGITSDGQYRLDVTATDPAGNKTATSRYFRMDASTPNISVTGLKEGEVTSDASMLRFCAGELFYDSTIMTAVLERFENGAYLPVSTTERVMKSQKDNMDIQVEEEGRYRLTCTAADRSGNSTSSVTSFTVDRTPPVISKVDDMNNRFFRSFELPGKLKDMIKDLTAVSADAYVNDTKIGENDVIIEDGKYVLTILAEDEAGNRSEKSATFMVDHTSPQIVLGGFDRNGNIKKGSIITVGLLEEDDRLVSVRFNDRDIAIGADNTATVQVNDHGRYTLEVRAEDAAQNVTDTQISTGCYMAGPSFDRYLTSETLIRSPEQGGEAGDPDLNGLFAGLIPVLAGTFGLTYRTFLRD